MGLKRDRRLQNLRLQDLWLGRWLLLRRRQTARVTRVRCLRHWCLWLRSAVRTLTGSDLLLRGHCCHGRSYC